LLTALSYSTVLAGSPSKVGWEIASGRLGGQRRGDGAADVARGIEGSGGAFPSQFGIGAAMLRPGGGEVVRRWQLGVDAEPGSVGLLPAVDLDPEHSRCVGPCGGVPVVSMIQRRR
jgi:hypothetical protein